MGSFSCGMQTKPDDSMELGVILCKHCNQVIGTLPTSGVKTLYGICPMTNGCPAQQPGGAHADE